MRIICKNCLPKEGIDIPEFSLAEKKQIVAWRFESKIRVVKHLMEVGQFNHLEAKFIATHFNVKYGECHFCGYRGLDKEYMICPKCEALNFNWGVEAFG